MVGDHYVTSPLGDNQYAIRDAGGEDEGDDDCRPRNWIEKVGLERNAVSRSDGGIDSRKAGRNGILCQRVAEFGRQVARYFELLFRAFGDMNHLRALRTTGLFICRNSGGKWRMWMRGACMQSLESFFFLFSSSGNAQSLEFRIFLKFAGLEGVNAGNSFGFRGNDRRRKLDRKFETWMGVRLEEEEEEEGRVGALGTEEQEEMLPATRSSHQKLVIVMEVSMTLALVGLLKI